MNIGAQSSYIFNNSTVTNPLQCYKYYSKNMFNTKKQNQTMFRMNEKNYTKYHCLDKKKSLFLK